MWRRHKDLGDQLERIYERALPPGLVLALVGVGLLQISDTALLGVLALVGANYLMLVALGALVGELLYKRLLRHG